MNTQTKIALNTDQPTIESVSLSGPEMVMLEARLRLENKYIFAAERVTGSNALWQVEVREVPGRAQVCNRTPQHGQGAMITTKDRTQ